jgi:hypothetical protein
MKKKDIHPGLRFIGGEDFALGVLFMVAGGVFFAFDGSSPVIWGIGGILLVIGLIFASIGLGDYFRS